MKINKLKINSFGKLKNKEIELKNKINVIYGENESGKSTILKFILNSLYGTSKNKNGKEISDYERYKPWNGEDFSGKLEYELDNGEKFEVYREFNKKNPIIFNEKAEDISKEFNIDKNRGNEFFYEQTKIDEKLFLSTSAILQQEVKIEKSMQNILLQKISNLVGTGQDNISYKKAIEKLNKKQLEEIGTERSREKPINLIKQEIENLEEEKSKLENYRDEIIEKEKEKNLLLDKINNEEIKNNLIKEIKILKENENLENERIKIKQKINEENIEKINKLKLEKNNLIENNKNVLEKNNLFNDKLSKEKNKLIIESLISVILFIIINILIYLNLDKTIFYIIFSLTLGIEIIFNLFLKNKLNKKIKNKNFNNKIEEEKINNKINNLENEINLLEKNKNNLNEEINKIKNEINLKNNLEKNKIKNNYSEKINLNEINYLINSENINYELEITQDKIYNYKIEENKVDIEKENIENQLDRLAGIEEKINALHSSYENLNKKSKAIDMAKSFLAVAYEKMKNNVSPNFIKTLSNNIKNITNGKYTNVKFNDEEGLIVELNNGNYVTSDRLSVGTIEQLYLSLRLAIIEEISKENIPIILDEAFAYYDDERLKNILEYINKIFNKKQIIILTCTNREKDILEKLNIDFNLIKI